MEVVEEAHDFGNIPQGTPVNHTFHFTNTGNKPLKIESVKPSCGCTAADYSKDFIQPGQTGFVKATYKASSAGVFAKTITVRSNADTPVKVFKLRGVVDKKSSK